MSGPPRLSLSTGGSAGPSTPNPVRRPQGARSSRRGGAGLFVANPDNSDSDVSPKASPVKASPATTSSQSSVRGVPISGVSGGSGGSIAGGFGAYHGSGGSGGGMSPSTSTSTYGRDPRDPRTHGQGGPTPGPASYRMSPSNSAPTVPAPNTPVPHSASYASPQSQAHHQMHSQLQSPMGPPSSVPLESAPHLPSVPSAPHVPLPTYPSYPPPQPKRHFTTPIPSSASSSHSVPDHAQQRAHEPRHASVSGSSHPSHRPAVHPVQHQQQHPHPHPHSPGRHLPPLPSPSLQSAPLLPHLFPESSMPQRPPMPHGHTGSSFQTSSPEDVMSPAGASDGGRSFASGNSFEGRNRSGSVQSHKTLLQVTMDNEQFILVDVTGMTSADGIKERVFAKMRLRDDDYAAYSFYRTEIGEAAAPSPLSSDQLLSVCLSQGDAKATLKFLIIQIHPTGSSASVVPPMQMPMPDATPTRRLPPIDTQLNRNRHSRDGSTSSASATTDRHTWSDVSHPESGSNTSYERQSQGQSAKGGPGSVGMGASGSSRSLQMHDTGAGGGAPSGSRMSSPSTHHYNPHSPIYQSQSSAQAGPSSSRPPQLPLGLGLGVAGVVDDDMDEATRALIAQLELEDQEAVRAEEERRRQMEADERIARQAQQNERDEWQAMQRQELEGSRRRQEQIERDEQRARDMEAEEIRAAESDRARQDTPHSQNRREASTGRTSNFYNERREMQHQWMQMPQAQTSPGTWHQPTVADGPPPFQAQSHDRRPSGGRHPSNFSPVSRYDGRVPDARYDEMGMRTDGQRPGQGQGQSQAGQAGTLPNRQRMPHPYGHGTDASLQNARSMDNLRPMGPPQPPPQGRPPQAPRTHTPSGPFYYSPSAEDLRFPEQHRTGMGSVPFPSPRPGRQGSTTSGEWLPYPPHGSGSGSGSGNANSNGYEATSPRPNSFPEQLRSASSPQRRPSTAHEHTPPASARSDYYPPGADAPYFARRGSFESPPVTGRPFEDTVRRTSHSDVPDRESLLPYRTGRSERRNNTGDSDNNTVSSGFSESTVRPDEGTSTARQGELMSRWRRMVRDNEVQAPGGEEDEDEATLWITAPKKPASPSRPSLSISTNQPAPPSAPSASASGLTSTTADSATESEGESASRMHRAKSFAKPKGEAAWHFRPEPEALYADLDAIFPKVDLDKPIPVVDSTPSTPLEPAKEEAGLLPPPVHPTRQNDSRLPQSPKNDKDRDKVAPPPHHPAAGAAAAAAGAGAGPSAVSKFNKAENRKSIRSIAQGALKHSGIARYMGDKVFGKSSADKAVDKKSGHLWGNGAGVKNAEPPQLTSPSSSSKTVPHVEEVSEPEEAADSASHDAHDTLSVPGHGADVEAASFSWVKGQMIGRGSYGKVYIALNVLSGKMMAVKQVELMGNDGDVKQKEMVNALKGEIALLKDLSHPNIVQYLGTETSDTHLSIFLEYVPGGTIASIYKAPEQGAFEEQLVKFFTKQILSGLAYLHGKPSPVLHRDLKGDNILVDANGVCKISDFGISKEASNAYDSFVAGTAMRGTPFWMAPEVVMPSKDKSYSGKADIWSLGCVLVEMWTGQRPWGVSEQIYVMLQLAGGRARPPMDDSILSAMSPDARDFLLNRCLAALPEERPTAIELLRHPFILDADPRWTFADSKTGKAVASQGARRLKQHATAATATATAGVHA